VSEGWIVRIEAIDGGAHVIRGTRITVYAVLERVDHGETLDELVKENPDIPRAAFEAAVAFARAHPHEHRISFADALIREGFEPTDIQLVIRPEEAAPRPHLWKADGVPMVDPLRHDRGFVGPKHDLDE